MAGEPGGSQGGSGSSGGSGATPGGGQGSNEGQSPPEPQRSPGSSALVAASASVGQGASGAVVGLGLGANPDADVTLGTTQVIGDAPPSQGTGVSLGGRLFPPQTTTPLLPG